MSTNFLHEWIPGSNVGVKFLDLVGVQSESELVAALSKCIFACLLDPKSAKQRKGDQVPSGQSQVPAPAAGDEKDNTAPASEMDINMDDCYDNNYPPAIIGSIVNNVMQRRFSQD